MKKTFEHLLDRRCDPAARAVLEDMLLERGKTVVAACGVGSGGVGGVGGVGGDGDGGYGGGGSGGDGGQAERGGDGSDRLFVRYGRRAL